MTEAAELQDNKSPVVKPHNQHGPCIFTGFKEGKTLKKPSQVQKKTPNILLQNEKGTNAVVKDAKGGCS